MQSQGQTSTLYGGKETRHKRPHIVQFHLYEIFGKNKSTETKRIVVAWTGGMKGNEHS